MLVAADSQCRLVAIDDAKGALNQPCLLVIECLLCSLDKVQNLEPVSVLKLLSLLDQMRCCCVFPCIAIRIFFVPCRIPITVSIVLV